MKQILITGAGGYIGSIASQQFLSQGYTVVGVDAYFTGFKEPLEKLKSEYPDSFFWYEADISDAHAIDSILASHPTIDAVVHFGASCVVKESMEKPELYFANNVYGSMQLLRALHVRGIHNVVFSSTCAVYGASQYSPMDEKHPTLPNNPYGESKRMGEQMMRWYHEIHAMKAVIFRYFNVYGASSDASLGYSKKPCTHLVDAAVQGALGLHQFTLTCGNSFDTPDGTPIRDYLHVLDLVDAHIRAVDFLIGSKKPLYEVINLGTGTGNTVLEIVQIVERELHVTLPRAIGEIRAGEDARLVADNKKGKSFLGWEPTRAISTSLPHMVKWYTSHPHGWKR